MDVQPYVDGIRRELVVAAEAGGDDARALGERLITPLEAAFRLAVQDVLVAAAEEITCELAPGSVELRLRGRDPEFVVTLPPADRADDDLSEAERFEAPGRPAPTISTATTSEADADDGGMSRINLRMPDQLKARIERAAGAEGVSVNSWLVRAATTAVERGDAPPRRESGTSRRAGRYTGWAR
jgi:hypothetical protein